MAAKLCRRPTAQKWMKFVGAHYPKFGLLTKVVVRLLCFSQSCLMSLGPA